MDTWILVGILVVFFVIIAPILAIIAISRTSRLNNEITKLNQRVFSLETIISKLTVGQKALSTSNELAKENAANNTHSLVNGESENGVFENGVFENSVTEPVVNQSPEQPTESDERDSPVLANAQQTENSVVIEHTLSLSEQEKITEQNTAEMNTPATNSPTPHVDPNRFNRRAQTSTQQNQSSHQPAVTPAPATASAADKSIFEHFFSWLVKGNPLAKVGILLLFLGVAYLLNYSVQNEIISPELRLVFSGVGCLALLGLGWWLRAKKTLFALILQGGAIGCLYITIFAAFKLYSMVPYGFAFGFMLLVCAASIALALLQRTISLAILASLGGYLAPVLLSTGGGSHVLLFSYYLMLSIGILIISLRHAWRPLNLVGMVMTYGVAALWGLEYYQPEFYISCQLFIIANLIVFNVLTQLFALRLKQDSQLLVDNTLLFAPPFISIALQFAISEGVGLMPAFVALFIGLLYLLAGLQIHKRYLELGRNMALGNIIIGAGFITLAIPLALSFEWTSIIWSLEGLLLLWFGLNQNQTKMSTLGALLILISALVLLSDYPYFYWSRSSTYMVPILLVACFCGGGLFHIHRKENSNYTVFSTAFLLVGLVVWYFWLLLFVDILSWSGESEAFITMALVVISVWLWRLFAIRINWVPLLLCQSLLWIAGYYYLGLDFLSDTNPMGRGEGSLIWPVMLGSSILFVIHAYKVRDIRMQGVLHGANLWLIIIFIATQVNWFVSILPWGMHELGYYIYIMAMAAIIFVLYFLQQRRIAPMKRSGLIYWYSILPMMAVLIGLSLFANLEDGKLTFWHYIPVVNPLDEAGLFSIAALVLMRKGFMQKLKNTKPHELLISQGLLGAVIILLACWYNGILIRAVADIQGLSWNEYDLFRSRVIQTSLSISWAIAALVCMVIAAIRKSRIWWFFGAGIFACVIAKLFLIDIYGQDGIARAVSFIGVALLILIVGYFSPLPPKLLPPSKDEKEMQS